MEVSDKLLPFIEYLSFIPHVKQKESSRISSVHSKAVFKIIHPEKTGSGFLFESKSGIKGLLTCQHVLGWKQDLSNIDFRSYEIYNFKKETYPLTNIKLTNANPIIDERLDFAFIPLCEDFIEVMKKKDIPFLKGATHFKVEDQLQIPQYAGRDVDLSVAAGFSYEIPTRHLLHHKISTEGGSSGSPLINEQGGVVGIHRGLLPTGTAEIVNLATKTEFIQARISGNPFNIHADVPCQCTAKSTSQAAPRMFKFSTLLV